MKHRIPLAALALAAGLSSADATVVSVNSLVIGATPPTGYSIQQLLQLTGVTLQGVGPGNVAIVALTDGTNVPLGTSTNPLLIDASTGSAAYGAWTAPIPAGTFTIGKVGVLGGATFATIDAAWGSLPTNAIGVQGGAGMTPLLVTPNASATITNPSSTYQLASSTSAYSAGNLMANSGTAGSVTVPSFAIATSGGGAYISRLRLFIDDGISPGFGSQTYQIDLWTTAPTFANGDHAAFAPATAINAHLASFTCNASAAYGTTGLQTGGAGGVYAACSPAVGSVVTAALASGTSIYWTIQAVTATSTITTGGATLTATAELSN